MATPYMSLTLPTPSVSAGPGWATSVNMAFEEVDSHDHTSGAGVPIRTAALSIDADLSFGGYVAADLRSARLVNHGAALSDATDIGCIFEVAGDLFYNNSIGQHVQITSGAGLNAASIGGIGGDYVGSGASVFYTSATLAYSFWSAANQYASMRSGPLVVHQPGVSSPYGITVQSPTSLAAAYSITLPAALPGATLPLLISSAGVMSSAQLATAQIADSAVTAAKTDAVSTATASRLMVRDAAGRVAVATPAASGDAATKGYVDTSSAAALSGGADLAGLRSLADLSRVRVGIPDSIAGGAGAGDWIAFDSTGANWIAADTSGGAFWYNGASVAYTAGQRWGDALWHYAADLFVFCQNTSGGIATVPATGGSATNRSGTGCLCLSYNHSSSTMIATQDGTPTNTALSSTNATSWTSRTLSQSGTWQGVCSLGSSGNLIVGNDASNNVVGCVSSSVSSWSNISLPSNTGGTVSTPRTSTTGYVRGVACGVAGTTVFILTASYIWRATLGADLTNSANWTRSSSPYSGYVPTKSRSIVGVAAVMFEGADWITITSDATTWIRTYPVNHAGMISQDVRGIGYCYRPTQRQLGLLVGAAEQGASVINSAIQIIG